MKKLIACFLPLLLLAAAPSKVVEVQLHWKSPDLTIRKVSVKHNLSPRPARDGKYAISLTDSNWHELLRIPFDIPNEPHVPPPLNPGDPHGPAVPRDNFRFAVTVPLVQGAAGVRLIDSEGTILDSRLIKHAKKPKKSKNKVKILKQVMDWFCPPVYAASFDITFIGDKYTDQARFQADAAAAAAYMLNYEPWKSRAAQLTIRTVENAEDLGCQHSDATDRLIVCRDSDVIAAVNDAGAPYDKIVVLVNDSQYGGSGGSTVAVAYNGSYMKQVVTHEFGHTGGGLADEYNLYGALTNSEKFYKNCWKGVSRPADWNEGQQGCYASNFWRQTPCSIMKSISCTYFNPISQQLIGDRITYYAGAIAEPEPQPVDNPPVIYADLEEGQQCRWRFRILASATDDHFIEKMELFIDNELRTSVLSDSINYLWHIWRIQEPGGKDVGPVDRVIKITAYDDAGQRSESVFHVVAYKTKRGDY